MKRTQLHNLMDYVNSMHVSNIIGVQGDPSGRGTLFVDIKFKVLSQYKLLIQ